VASSLLEGPWGWKVQPSRLCQPLWTVCDLLSIIGEVLRRKEEILVYTTMKGSTAAASDKKIVYATAADVTY
jgi:hypothetical protein